LLAGGGFALYWYLTNYGPNGAAYDATGKKVNHTWWDSTPFGAFDPNAQIYSPATGATATGTVPTASTPATVNAPSTTPVSTGIPTVYQGGGNATTPGTITSPPTIAPIASSGMTAAAFKARMLQTAIDTTTGNVYLNLNVDQWEWYRALFLPVSRPLDELIPIVGGDRTKLIDLDTYVAALTQIGLFGPTGMGDIVPVPSLPSFRGSKFAGARIQRSSSMARKGWVQ
jgi:hypothetical protein